MEETWLSNKFFGSHLIEFEQTYTISPNDKVLRVELVSMSHVEHGHMSNTEIYSRTLHGTVEMARKVEFTFNSRKSWFGLKRKIEQRINQAIEKVGNDHDHELPSYIAKAENDLDYFDTIITGTWTQNPYKVK